MSAHFQGISSCRLYGILDLGYVARENVVSTARLLTEGPEDKSRVDILQLRAKGSSPDEILAMAREILPVTRDNGVPLIINDHPEIAANIGADGVHVGQDDSSIEATRSIVGKDAIDGKSTHSLEQAILASGENLDYIGFGPLFTTPTKPGRPAIGVDDIAAAHRQLPDSFPVFCIRGIKLENLPAVLGAGARRVVIVSGILQAPDIPPRISRIKALLPARA